MTPTPNLALNLTPNPTSTPAPSNSFDTRSTEALIAWFPSAARPLPWRPNLADPTRPRDPYSALVSELMLQQTQVSRVLDRFEPFLQRFPTAKALAAASEESVLAAWSGLGYYRRARLLHAAAKAVVQHHQGRVPTDPAQLIELPGIGRYTAGAIASIVAGHAVPIVDGNVARVLQRLHAMPGHAADPAITAWTWSRATDLALAAGKGTHRVGIFNEALMELGATVCTPKQPACDRCPLAHLCLAKAQGLQHDIPAPKPRAKRQTLTLAALLLRDTQGRVLLEHRPAKGLWARTWMPPLAALDPNVPAQPHKLFALPKLQWRTPTSLPFQTTHRDVTFHILQSKSPIAAKAAEQFLTPTRRWTTAQDRTNLSISSATALLLQRLDP